MNRLFYRPLLVIIFLAGLLALTELVALSGVSWKNLQRISKVKQDIAQSHQLEQLLFILLDKSHSDSHKRQLIQHFIQQQTVAPQILTLLKQIHQMLEAPAHQGEEQDVLAILHQTLTMQLNAEEQLLDKIYQASELELKLAILVPTGMVLLFLLGGQFYFKRFVTKPANDLERLLSSLAEGNRQPVKPGKAEASIRPLFISYNKLVSRLTALEKEHQQHTASLEKEVRNATHSLLEQSHSLAQAERLAAVGELAASAAHELRNPLAGIQVALENMCAECQDADFKERLQLVHAEIKRLTARLNDLLAYSKQRVEMPGWFDLHDWIADLMTLLRYQIDENIQIHLQCEQNLRVFLPKNTLRQALLNLLLNAVQSIGQQSGDIWLSVDKSADYVSITVTDSGQGFPETLLQQGVRPFASYKKQGTGLGLPMVRRFARSQGGDLNVWNNEQGFACVCLKLAIRDEK